jgi:hypothetical protein
MKGSSTQQSDLFLFQAVAEVNTKQGMEEAIKIIYLFLDLE